MFYQSPGYSCVPLAWAGSPQELAPTPRAPRASLGFQQCCQGTCPRRGGSPGTQHGLLYSPPGTGCSGDGLSFSDALPSPSLRSKRCSVKRYPAPSGAVSCKAPIHRELTLPVQRRRELFEGCGLPGVLSAQVLSVLPQPSQRQHKSRKAYFCSLATSSEKPTPAARQVASERGTLRPRRGGEGKHLTFLQMHGAYILLFTMLDRLRGRNDF